MRVILKDPEAEGAVEVWTRDLAENVRLMQISTHTMAEILDGCVNGGSSSEPDPRCVTEGVVDVLTGWGLKDTNAMYRAVMTFVEPRPAYHDDLITFEV